MHARPRKHKLAVKKLSKDEAMPRAAVHRVDFSPTRVASRAGSKGSLNEIIDEVHSENAIKDDLQTSSAGFKATFMLRHASAHLLESGIEATMHDIEQILPAFSWDVSAWGQKAKTFVHDVVAKPLWDGIAQVDEIISTAALPQQLSQDPDCLPLSDKAAPVEQHHNSSVMEPEALAWGDFDIDDIASTDHEDIKDMSIIGAPGQAEEMESSSHTCMMQRSPLHPPTPHRRSPDHESSDASTRAPSENVSTSCDHGLDVRSVAGKFSMIGVGDLDRGRDVASGMKALEHQFQQLLSENARLQDEVDSRGGDDIMTQQLLQQLQAAMADKSKINKEKDELIRENCDLRMLLAYLSGEGDFDNVLVVEKPSEM